MEAEEKGQKPACSVMTFRRGIPRSERPPMNLFQGENGKKVKVKGMWKCKVEEGKESIKNKMVRVNYLNKS